MKKPTFIILVLILAVIILSVIRTYVANNIATSGVILSDVEIQKAKLETENAILSEKLYTQTSLSEISKKAEKLGFSENKKNFAISGQRPVAFKQ
ncbi:MAG: hypothetical protein A3B38_01895 [Candidatus Levybacteria bacterium RIFCSPLOWO2_01_FULL_36_13]|nr:MAG: hypothetical protein A2684_03130 [Candidatus Levybacteria bacterium RIFCSPHIGHO2_01_FULL_36_15b]OGH35614.1 MAG: hypothetical protein A3B38_01895 [Candidatus Levybacteria bacterium RIFCSPLOWO2_01_FULL_36_13]